MGCAILESSRKWFEIIQFLHGGLQSLWGAVIKLRDVAVGEGEGTLDGACIPVVNGCSGDDSVEGQGIGGFHGYGAHWSGG